MLTASPVWPQIIADYGIRLLCALANELSAWSHFAAEAIEQQQQSGGEAFELCKSGERLLLAACTAMQLMREHGLCRMVDEQAVVETLAHLVQQAGVVTDQS